MAGRGPPVHRLTLGSMPRSFTGRTSTAGFTGSPPSPRDGLRLRRDLGAVDPQRFEHRRVAEHEQVCARVSLVIQRTNWARGPGWP